MLAHCVFHANVNGLAFPLAVVGVVLAFWGVGVCDEMALLSLDRLYQVAVHVLRPAAHLCNSSHEDPVLYLQLLTVKRFRCVLFICDVGVVLRPASCILFITSA